MMSGEVGDVGAQPDRAVGSTARRQTPARWGWGMVPPPRLPARPMRDVAMITSPVELTATERMGAAAGIGRQPNSAHAAPATSDRVHTHPFMSPTKRRGPRRTARGRRWRRAGSWRGCGVLAAGQVAAVEPDAQATLVDHPRLALVVRAQDGRVGCVPLADGGEQRRHRAVRAGDVATISDATPREPNGSAPPRDHVARPPRAAAVVGDEEALAVTAGHEPARWQLGDDGHEAGPVDRSRCEAGRGGLAAGV